MSMSFWGCLSDSKFKITLD
nr:unnamed protein product [Callosobruchus chinensis]